MLESLNIDDLTKIYMHVDETDSAYVYLIAPMNNKSKYDTDFVRMFDNIFIKRKEQIQTFPLECVRHIYQEPIMESDKEYFDSIFSEIHENYCKEIGNSNKEILRQLCAKFSIYANDISKCMGAKFFKHQKIQYEHLEYFPNKCKILGSRRIALGPHQYFAMLRNLINSSQYNPDEIPYEIILYVHSGSQYLAYNQYVHLVSKSMLFMFDGQETGNKIAFIETNVPVDEDNIKEFTKKNVKQIHLKIVGHSHPNFKVMSLFGMNIPFNIEQTVGGLNGSKLGEHIANWYEEYFSPGTRICEVKFVSCELATMRKFNVHSECLPKKSFLANFIREIAMRKLNNIKKIIAYNEHIEEKDLNQKIKMQFSHYPEDVSQIWINLDIEKNQFTIKSVRSNEHETDFFIVHSEECMERRNKSDRIRKIVAAISEEETTSK